MEKYYREKAISNSGLNQFEKSPLSYKINVLERNIEEAESKDLYKGRLIHQAILEPDTIRVMDLEAPSDKMCELIEYYNEIYDTSLSEQVPKEEYELSCLETAHEHVGYKTSLKSTITKFNDKKSQDYLNFLRENNDPRNVVVSKDIKNTIDSCINSLYQDEKISEFLNKIGNDNVYVEYPIYWNMKVNDLDLALKSKLDYIEIIQEDDGKVVVNHMDLKTTSSIIFTNRISSIDLGDIRGSLNSTYGFVNSIIKYRYYRQLAFYEEAIKYDINKRLGTSYDDITVNHYIAAVSTVIGEAALFEIPSLIIKAGFEEIMELLFSIQWHIREGVWDKNREYYEKGIIKLDNI